MLSRRSDRRSPRPVDRRPRFRLPNALPMGSSRLSQLLRPRRSRQHARYAAAVAAEKTRLLQNVAAAATQFADAKRLGMPLTLYAARLSTAQREARKSDVVIRDDEISRAKRDGANASDRQAARAIIAGVQRRHGTVRGPGPRGGSKGTRRRGRTRRRRKSRRRRARRRSR